MNMNSNKPLKKITRGRQKIEIKKIVKKENRQVTFTKRRNGVFKKAAELCILTGADVAVFVKSHSGRIWAFAHPDVREVVERFSSGGGGCGSGGGCGPSAEMEEVIREFNIRYDEVAKELEAEKRRKEFIESGVANTDRFWWQDESIEGLGLDQLDTYVTAIEELKEKVTMMLISGSNSMQYSSPMLAMNQMNGENPMQYMNQMSCENSMQNSSEMACNYFANQAHDSSTSSLVPLSYDFGYGVQPN